jgi:hypothetical protein
MPIPEYRKSTRVHLVNAEKIRSSGLTNQEFGVVGLHSDFPSLIPPGEVWLDENVEPEERRILVDGALAVERAQKGGLSEDDAYERGQSVERAEREKEGLSSGGRQPGEGEEGGPALSDVRTSLWKELPEEGLKVYLVDGHKVRDLYKTDFVEGGNGEVYPWVPRDEIWLEDTLSENEKEYTLMHETAERKLMQGGMGYDEAHKKASRIEFMMRKEGTAAGNGEGKVVTDTDAVKELKKQLSNLMRQAVRKGIPLATVRKLMGGEVEKQPPLVPGSQREHEQRPSRAGTRGARGTNNPASSAGRSEGSIEQERLRFWNSPEGQRMQRDLEEEAPPEEEVEKQPEHTPDPLTQIEEDMLLEGERARSPAGTEGSRGSNNPDSDQGRTAAGMSRIRLRPGKEEPAFPPPPEESKSILRKSPLYRKR